MGLLSHLPPEVVVLVTRCLDGFSTTKLWLCGDAAVRRSMYRGGVQNFEVVFGLPSKTINGLL